MPFSEFHQFLLVENPKCNQPSLCPDQTQWKESSVDEQYFQFTTGAKVSKQSMNSICLFLMWLKLPKRSIRISLVSEHPISKKNMHNRSYFNQFLFQRFNLLLTCFPVTFIVRKFITTISETSVFSVSFGNLLLACRVLLIFSI